MKQLHVLSWGGGTQSTALMIKFLQGKVLNHKNKPITLIYSNFICDYMDYINPRSRFYDAGQGLGWYSDFNEVYMKLIRNSYINLEKLPLIQIADNLLYSFVCGYRHKGNFLNWDLNTSERWDFMYTNFAWAPIESI